MKTLSGKSLAAIAIERLQLFKPSGGYYVAYSGGKDSDVVLDLVRKSGVEYTAHHALTTADPPEVVQHVKEQPDVQIHRPAKTMWHLIREHHCPPRRNMRYCCHTQKEPGGAGRIVVTGPRRDEGANRSKRQMIEPCLRDESKTYFNPIIDWSTSEVWAYIKAESLSYCSLYDEGFTRLGCVLCPMVRDVCKHLERWPQLCRAWERAIKATFKPEKGTWATADEYWQWWLRRDEPAPPKDRDNWLFDPWEAAVTHA